MLTRLALPAAAATLFALAACDSKTPEPTVIDTNPDPMAAQLANAAPVELPPAIKADKTMRCKNGELVYVTFFEGDKQAVVRTDKAGASTVLKAPEAGQPLVADGGWSMTGNASSVEVTVPEKGKLSCHA
jgi:predicted small lipoprotein YifL